MLGAAYLMTHLGSYKDLGPEKGFKALVDGLAESLKGYKGSTQLLVEISAGSSNAIGSTFEELGKIVHHPKLKNKVGICYDTQHGFVAGYDCRTPKAAKATLDKFDKEIGLEYFKMSHCNDSKTDFSSHLDRHDHIGEGKIGLAGFKSLLSDKRLAKVNFILETEDDKVIQDFEIFKKIKTSV